MKIKSIILSSLFIALFTGCSVQSKELDQPLTQAEKETTVAWKDTLDEGIFDELDRQKVLSELYKENMTQTALVEQEELETEIADQGETTVEETEVAISKTETTTKTQQKVSEKATAPVQSKKETVQAKTETAQAKPKTETPKAPTTNNQTTKPKEQIAAPKPKSEPNPEPKQEENNKKLLAAFFYEIGNSGKVFSSSEEAWNWAEKKLTEYIEKDPYGYSRFGVRSYYVNDNSPEKWTVDFME